MYRWLLVIAACGKPTEPVQQPPPPVAADAVAIDVMIGAIDATAIDATPIDAAMPVPVDAAPRRKPPVILVDAGTSDAAIAIAAPPKPDLAALGPTDVVVPVRGKWTVVDFWAAWCAPCKVLGKELEAMAAHAPSRIALRELDVEDSDSAAWAKYLAPGKFELPHVKIYDPSGKLVFERSPKAGAGLADFTAAIRAALGN